ncbi:snurportin-1-like isoform X2 [Cucurbita maxima]|uniref:Snurportin-1 n=1 Tax=Cucurbita maxima TaxID=3661 RepID=A0A6J1JHX0_CUCMA|nr:snurportin-1-like isoform X2 [Cucurbita maxima]
MMLCSFISRLRNGSILHRFPSALPNGAKTKKCLWIRSNILYSKLYISGAEFRFFWLNSKLVETGACEPPSYYHEYKFSLIPLYTCHQNSLYVAYTGAVPFVKDDLLFYKHSHYQPDTPLALVWKDENCSRYVIDTDKMDKFQASSSWFWSYKVMERVLHLMILLWTLVA